VPKALKLCRHTRIYFPALRVCHSRSSYSCCSWLYLPVSHSNNSHASCPSTLAVYVKGTGTETPTGTNPDLVAAQYTSGWHRLHGAFALQSDGTPENGSSSSDVACSNSPIRGRHRTKASSGARVRAPRRRQQNCVLRVWRDFVGEEKRVVEKKIVQSP
jgi:hypothetical protein